MVQWCVLLTLALSGVCAQDCATLNNSWLGGVFDSDLPLIVIKAPSAIPPSGADKVFSTMQIFDNRPGRTSLAGTPNNYDGFVNIGRRGQSSDAIYCKKQYGVKTRFANDTKMGASLLGMPEESDWVIQGPYSDKSLQRQALMMTLSNSLGLYAPRFVYVELFLIEDGSSAVDYGKHYRGVYLLMEQIIRGKDRVDIKKLTDKSTDLSGGYIVKKDKSKSDELLFQTWGNIVFTLVYPEIEDVLPSQTEWIGSYLSCFETSLYSSDFTDSVVGYPAYINATSFIDYFLLTELSNNADSYKYSTYFSKDKNGLLNMGPLWDYDLAWGNIADWLDAAASCRPQAMSPNPPCTQFFKYEVSARAQIADISAWYARLFADPVFKSQVLARWQALRGDVLSDASITAFVEANKNKVAEAAVRNFQLWRDPGIADFIWPEPNTNTSGMSCCFRTFDEHVQFLLSYVLGRAAWMDGKLAEPMYSIGPVRPPALSCCADPSFTKCLKPDGNTCVGSPSDISNGIGQYYDTECKPGIPGTDGCVDRKPEGACRKCLTTAWTTSSGAGQQGWLSCNLCALRIRCNGTTVEDPTPAPFTGRPTSAGETAQPTIAASPTAASPTAASPTAASPTAASPTSAKPPSIGAAAETPGSDVSPAIFVGAGAGALLLLVVVGLLLMRRNKRKQADRALHQGLLQGER